jgi:hypothetical protein
MMIHTAHTHVCHALGNFACPTKTDPRWYFPKPSSVTCYLVTTHQHKTEVLLLLFPPVLQGEVLSVVASHSFLL